MTRNEAREIMMQILYELEASNEMNEETALRLAEEKLAGNHVQRGRDLLAHILGSLEDIDGQIDRCSNRWKTKRMPKVDLAIMRLAVGEMRFSDDISDAVAINEAIKIARKYSTADSSKFIHGVLGAISRESGDEARSEQQ